MLIFGKPKEPRQTKATIEQINVYFTEKNKELYVKKDDSGKVMLIDSKTGNKVVMDKEECDELGIKAQTWVEEYRAAILKKALD